MREFHEKTCRKCGRPFKSLRSDAEHCDKHRRFDTKFESSVGNLSCATQTKEERLEKNRERLRLYRLAKGMKPLSEKRKIRKKVVRKKVVTSAVILQTVVAAPVAVRVRCEPSVWLHVDKRTRIGFINEKQMEEWKEKRK